MYNFTNAPLPPALLQQQIMQMLAAAGAGQPQGGTGIVPPPPGIAPPAGFPTPMGPPAGVPQQIAQAPQAVPPSRLLRRQRLLAGFRWKRRPPLLIYPPPQILSWESPS